MNLWLGTAVPRTTAFVVVPFGFALAVLAGALLEKLPSAPSTRGLAAVLRSTVVAAVSLPLAVLALPIGLGFGAKPYQDWQGAAGYVARTFPDGTGVASTIDDNGVLRSAYLADDLVVDPHERTERLLAGGAVLIDATKGGPPSYDFTRIAEAYSEVRLRQRLGGYLRVLAPAPAHPEVDRVYVGGRPVDIGPLTDRDRRTHLASDVEGARTTIRMVPRPGITTRSITMLFDGPAPSVAAVRAYPANGGGPVALDVERATGFGSTLTVAVGDRAVRSVEIDVTGDPAARSLPALGEVWAYTDR